MDQGASTPGARTAAELLIVFMDLSRFTLDTRSVDDDARVADLVDDLYERMEASVVGSGGRVVKFIGDAGLAVFPLEAADAGVRALLDLKRDIDAWLGSLQWGSTLVVKVHCGTVIAGAFGGRGAKRFDVIGNVVNATARLETRGFAISAQAFRSLEPETRRRFKKHTPPVTYLPVEAARP